MKILILLLFITTLYSNDKILFATIKDDIFIDSQIQDVAFSLINKQLEKDESLNVKFLIDMERNALRKYEDGTYKVLSISALSYFKHQKELIKSTKDYTLPIISNEAFSQFILIANKKQKNILQNLKDYTIYIPDGHQISEIWLTNLLHKKHKINLKKHKKQIKYLAKAIQKVNKIFFNEKAIAVIRGTHFKLLRELNPQIDKNVVVLEKSPKIYFNYMALINKDTSQKQIDILYELSNKVHIFVKRNNLSTLGELKGVHILKQKEIQTLIKEIEFYNSIK